MGSNSCIWVKVSQQATRQSTSSWSVTAVEAAAKISADALENLEGSDYHEPVHCDKYPQWFQKSTCGMKRTLILNAHTSVDVNYIAKQFGGIEELHIQNGIVFVKDFAKEEECMV